MLEEATGRLEAGALGKAQQVALVVGGVEV